MPRVKSFLPSRNPKIHLEKKKGKLCLRCVSSWNWKARLESAWKVCRANGFRFLSQSFAHISKSESSEASDSAHSTSSEALTVMWQWLSAALNAVRAKRFVHQFEKLRSSTIGERFSVDTLTLFHFWEKLYHTRFQKTLVRTTVWNNWAAVSSSRA